MLLQDDVEEMDRRCEAEVAAAAAAARAVTAPSVPSRISSRPASSPRGGSMGSQGNAHESTGGDCAADSAEEGGTVDVAPVSAATAALTSAVGGGALRLTVWKRCLNSGVHDRPTS